MASDLTEKSQDFSERPETGFVLQTYISSFLELTLFRQSKLASCQKDVDVPYAVEVFNSPSATYKHIAEQDNNCFSSSLWRPEGRTSLATNTAATYLSSLWRKSDSRCLIPPTSRGMNQTLLVSVLRSDTPVPRQHGHTLRATWAVGAHCNRLPHPYCNPRFSNCG
ncbi:hypothetical protein J6590_047490 [Homalodisca vitripennis]|nr:hypothetical protein J6590_047490 [Homalodisca vitripennis]